MRKAGFSSWKIRGYDKLQWGRTFSSAERAITASDGTANSLLQWGLTFSSAESANPNRGTPNRLASFNGAALFQVRKVENCVMNQVKLRLLQWGRTFSSAERLVLTKQDVIDIVLQWGRTFSSAESGLRPIGITTLRRLQWGRTFSSAERIAKRATLTPKLMLQWGRTFSSAESDASVCRRIHSFLASMGPHFFKCGKSSQACLEAPSRARFNGAALFQVRKVRRRRCE